MSEPIVISHRHCDGTIATGTTKDDGSGPILKARRWRWSRQLQAWYVPRSRDTQANTTLIEDTRQALADAGLAVEVDIDDTPRPTADVEADRADRAAARAERQQNRAARLRDESDASWSAGREILDQIPLGQPVLVGHHSEQRHRRVLEKVDRLHRKSADADRDAKEAQRRADVATARQETRYTARAVAARLERLETERRRLSRGIEGSSHTFAGGYVESYAPATGERLERLTRERDQVDDQLSYWRGVLQRRAADGAKLLSKESVAAGDEVQLLGKWYPVVRANKKTVTIPSIVGGSWTDTIAYHALSDHRPAEQTSDKK